MSIATFLPKSTILYHYAFLQAAVKALQALKRVGGLGGGCDRTHAINACLGGSSVLVRAARLCCSQGSTCEDMLGAEHTTPKSSETAGISDSNPVSAIACTSLSMSAPPCCWRQAWIHPPYRCHPIDADALSVGRSRLSSSWMAVRVGSCSRHRSSIIAVWKIPPRCSEPNTSSAEKITHLAANKLTSGNTGFRANREQT